MKERLWKQEEEEEMHHPRTTTANDDEDDEEECLVEGAKNKKNNTSEETDDSAAAAVVFRFSIRTLASIVLIFWSISHVLLVRQCTIATVKRDLATQPMVQQWTVVEQQSHKSKKQKPVPIWSSTKDSAKIVAHVFPGDTVETLNADGVPFGYRMTLHPELGFMETLEYDYDILENPQPVPGESSSFCPMMYEGWWGNKSSRISTHNYAPTPLVVAQQFWNAAQVFSLFLLLALWYDCFYANSNDNNNSPNDAASTARRTNHRKQQRINFKRAIIVLLVLGSCGISPFSSQLISPGAHIFATLTLVAMVMAFFMIPPEQQYLRLSFVEKRPSLCYGKSKSTSSSWTMTREETLACCCNLGSSLYNYAGSTSHWPHWKTHFKVVDHYFGWPTSGNVFWDSAFTLGISTERVPLFVPRATGGSTLGATQFFFVWSILPFLYVSYFGCLFLLSASSAKSPTGKWIQRLLALFGMTHFLFFTDVVAYRYGRGYHSPHGELFHWSEKWAWRIAILLPIYQHLTNGHWKSSSSRCYPPIVIKLFRGFWIAWCLFFIIFQVIQSDVMKFTQFLGHHHQKGLIEIWGLDERFDFFNKAWVQYPYREALITMIFLYGPFLHLSGMFSLFQIQLSSSPGAAATTANNNDDDSTNNYYNNNHEGLLSKIIRKQQQKQQWLLNDENDNDDYEDELKTEVLKLI